MLTAEAITAKLAKLSPANVPSVVVSGDDVKLTYDAASHGVRVSGDVEALRTLDGQSLDASEQHDVVAPGGNVVASYVVALHYGAKPAKS